MAIEYIYPPFEVIRRDERCTRCRICEKQCANGVHTYDAERKIMLADESKCVNCQRCVALCPTRAIKIVKTDCCLRENENWKSDTIREVYKQAATGGILLSSTGNPTPLPGYWDRLLINASQVTNPSIDPLREPMETRVFLGKKPDTIRRRADGSLDTTLPPQLELSVPILFSAMSYGSISYNAHAALARAAEELGIYYNTGEGGLHRDFYKYGANTIVQVASGRFGIEERCLNAGAAIEIKMGQGAKPGIGGHLPGAKIVGDVSKTRMIPEGSDAISPAPHHDIYSIEDLRQLVYSLKEATQYKKPVIVKVAAVHNIAAIASGIARNGADIIATIGIAVCGVGLLLASSLDGASSLWVVTLVQLVIGSGIALFASPNTSAIMTSVDEAHMGQASGLVGTARTLGTLSSMVIISLTMNAYLGDEALGLNNIPEFLEAMHINFALFGILNLLGIFCSLGRMGGRVRRFSHRLFHPWNHH